MKATQGILLRILNVCYRCSQLNSEFMVTGISGNQAQAQLSFRGMVIPVSIYHHPGCPETLNQVIFWFAGADIDPKEFVGGTGRYTIAEGQLLPGSIRLGGAYPSETDIATFTGTYVRID